MIFRPRLSATILIGLVATFALTANERQLLREAEFRFASGNYELAIDRFESLLDEYPRSVHTRTARFRIAQSYFFLGNYTRARDRFTAFAARFPGDRAEFSIDLWLGLSTYHLGDREESERSLTAFLDERGEGTADALIGRAYLYRALNALRRTDIVATQREQDDLEAAIAHFPPERR